jgi:hypothetical protein
MEIVYATTTTDISALATAAGQTTTDTAIGLVARESGGNIAAILAKITASAATEATLAALKALLPNALISNRLDVNIGAASATVPVSASGTVTANIGTSGSLALDATAAAILAKQPTSPALDRTTAGTPFAVRPSDGSAFISPALESGNLAGIKTDLDTLNSTVSTAANQATEITALGTLHTDSAAILAKIIAAPATAAAQTTAQTSFTSIDGKTPALGQALAAASSPVVLTAIQIAQLAQDRTTAAAPVAVRPSDGSAFIAPALEGGNLATLATNLPAKGQALAAASTPVVLTAIQVAQLAQDRTTAASPAAVRQSDGSAFIAPALEGGNLSTLATNLPAKGQALAAASMPVVLTAIQVAALAQDRTTAAAPFAVRPSDGSAFISPALEAGNLASIKTLLGQSQQAVANSHTIINPSDKSLRVVDCTPTGAVWTTSVGLAVTLTAAGTLIVPATAGQYLRSVNIENPTNAAAIFYFLYHGTSPTWSVTGLTIATGTLISSSQVGAANSANAIADLPGGLLVPNGVTLVIANVSGAVANVTYAAPVSACWATVRYGT